MAGVFSEAETTLVQETPPPTEDPRKEKVKRDWTRAKESSYPNIPEKLFQYQVDVISLVLDPQDKSHAFVGVPTGWGKSWCILGCALLLPEGSMTLVIPALTTIQNQLEEEALHMGLTVLNVNKTAVNDLRAALNARPQIVLANVDTIANLTIQEVLGSVRFGVGRRSPIVAVDELQVVDPVAGWTFREYGTTTWEFVLASLRPKFLMCSATMSEASLSRAAGNMGLSRSSIKVFFKPPLKKNIFQEVASIKRLSYRRFFRDIGHFILPLIASQMKIQIFIRSRDLLCSFETLVKICLEESGCSVTPEMVDRLSGNNSGEKKESVMIAFQDRLQVLMCTSVAAMGCHTGGLNLGISLGVASNTWTMVQQAGRVGRKEEEQAVFITVAETSSNTRVRNHEREEHKAVKAMFSNVDECIRAKMYSTFVLDDAKRNYSDMETPSGRCLDRGEQFCSDCHCCTHCSLQCGTCQEVGEPLRLLDRVCKVLDIDMFSEDFRAMEAYVDAKLAEEKEDFPTDDEEEEEEEVEEAKDDSDVEELSELVARNFLSDDSDDD